MAKYFAIVSEKTGNLEDGHICYCSNDSDMDNWKVESGYKLVELTSEEHFRLGLLDIVAMRDGEQVIVTAEDVKSDDNAGPVFKHKIDTGKLERNVKDRPKIDVPIEIEGIGGKEIIGYEQIPVTIVIERTDQITKLESELEK